MEASVFLVSHAVCARSGSELWNQWKTLLWGHPKSNPLKPMENMICMLCGPCFCCCPFRKCYKTNGKMNFRKPLMGTKNHKNCSKSIKSFANWQLFENDDFRSKKVREKIFHFHENCIWSGNNNAKCMFTSEKKYFFLDFVIWSGICKG